VFLECEFPIFLYHPYNYFDIISALEYAFIFDKPDIFKQLVSHGVRSNSIRYVAHLIIVSEFIMSRNDLLT